MDTITSSDAEQHLLFVLLDSNLPTGGFVASSGLESFAKHGHLPANRRDPTEGILTFVRESVRNYAASTLPFADDAWSLISRDGGASHEPEKVVEDLCRIDHRHDAMMLNHVSRRSSTAQGIALLTLYTKGLAPPSDAQHTSAVEQVIDRFKLRIRKGQTPGHLAVCWGLITGALDMSIGEWSVLLDGVDSH